MVRIPRVASSYRRMRGQTLGIGVLAVSLTAGVAGFAAAPAAAATTSCTSYQLVMSRGTGEPQGNEFLVLGPTATKVQAATPGGSVYNVVYPAGIDYINGPVQGGNDIKKHLAAQVAACPNQRFVLGGYSEGAMTIFSALKTLPATTKPKISAIVLFGDPYYQSNKSWDAAGNAKGNFSGVAALLGAGSPFPSYASLIQDYCAPSDLVCGSGASIVGHLSYSSKVTAAATFIEGKLSGQTATAAVAPATTAAAAAAPSAASAATAKNAGSGFDFSSLLTALFGASNLKLGSLFG